MKILLIEDNEKLAKNIESFLTDKGYSVEIAYDGDSGLDLALEKNYSCILLDIILPGLNGFELSEFLRKEEINSPILMLTALEDVDNKIKGFGAGADDYLSKPFDLRELFARIKALIRRNQLVKAEDLRVGKLTLNSKKREVFFDKKILKLSVKEFSILELFMKNPEIAFTRERIYEILWDNITNQKSNIIDVYVLYLRRKLKAVGCEDYIETIPGTGYRLKCKENENRKE
jgi:two-component system copper resistance phosphate regulon response regulator CusR